MLVYGFGKKIQQEGVRKVFGANARFSGFAVSVADAVSMATPVSSFMG